MGREYIDILVDVGKEKLLAFTKRELILVSDSDFEIISEAEMYIALKSINTDYCWNIFKNTIEAGKHVILYHKYKIDEKHYKKV